MKFRIIQNTGVGNYPLPCHLYNAKACRWMCGRVVSSCMPCSVALFPSMTNMSMFSSERSSVSHLQLLLLLLLFKLFNTNSSLIYLLLKLYYTYLSFHSSCYLHLIEIQNLTKLIYIVQNKIYKSLLKFSETTDVQFFHFKIKLFDITFLCNAPLP